MAIQVNPEIITSADRSYSDSLESALAAAAAPACDRAWVRRFDEGVRAAARALDLLRAAGQPMGALAGWPVSVKDLFDVAGHPTTAGSRVLAGSPAAPRDCPPVARLRAAGALLLGHTNLSEFAYSGVGLNPHFGTPVNPAMPSAAAACVPGGSTSGGAVTVATGACRAALGSDTGGSIRIPAALQGLVGFKGTQHRVSRRGSIALSTTLDTVCAITRDVRDAARVDAVLAGLDTTPRDAGGLRPLAAFRLGVPTTLVLDSLQPEVARAFDAALQALSGAGARIESVPLPQLARLTELQALGSFAAAESWARHRHLLATERSSFDPRVATRMERGAQMTAADYIDLHDGRSSWIEQMGDAMRGYDAMLSPTVPILAPPIAPLLADDDAFFGVNSLLLRNPSLVNMLDGCALSLPCQAPGAAPVGLMIWAAGGADARVLELAAGVEAALAVTFGADRGGSAS